MINKSLEEIHSQGKEVADLVTDFASDSFQGRSWRQTVKYSNVGNKILYCTCAAISYYAGALMGIAGLALRECKRRSKDRF